MHLVITSGLWETLTDLRTLCLIMFCAKLEWKHDCWLGLRCFGREKRQKRLWPSVMISLILPGSTGMRGWWLQHSSLCCPSSQMSLESQQPLKHDDQRAKLHITLDSLKCINMCTVISYTSSHFTACNFLPIEKRPSPTPSKSNILNGTLSI